MRYSVFVGDVALDEYYRADYWPGLKDKAMVDTLPAVPGGMIANAACVAATLGLSVKFFSVLNSGAITQLLLKDLRDYGIDTSPVSFDESLADSKTMIFLAGNEHAILIPRLGMTNHPLTAAQLDLMAGAEYIYSTPSELGRLVCGEMQGVEIVDYCRAKGAQVVVDLDVDYIKDGDEERFRHVDIAFFNEVGFDSFRAGRDHQVAAERLIELGVKIAVVTLAENGCMVHSAEGTLQVPGFKVEVLDVTGAGDTFCSAFIFALSKKKNLAEAARFANAAAAICVGKLGARSGAVSEQQVLDFLASRAA